MSNITINELALWRNNAFAHRLIDVRRAEKRNADACEISDGMWLNPANWLDWKDQIANDQPVVLYCAYGHEISQGLCAALRAMGIDARTLDGGIHAWREAGQATLALPTSLA